MSLSIGYCCLKYSPENLDSVKKLLIHGNRHQKTELHLHDSPLLCCPIGSASDTPILFLKSAGSIFWTGSHIKEPDRPRNFLPVPCPLRLSSDKSPPA